MRSWHERKARHRGQVGHALTASSAAVAAPQPDVRIADAKTAAGRMPAPLLTSDNFRLSVVRRELSHHVSLDKAIKTLRETGADMKDKYQETARGGLAVNVIEC